MNDSSELPLQVWVINVEALGDELGVLLVFSEDDCFSKLIAAAHFLASRHEVFQNLVDRVGVEQPLIQRFGLYPVGGFPILAPIDRVPLLLFFLGQILVVDTLALE